jgi:hypothetical protein
MARKYNPQQIAAMQRAGAAYRRRDGRVVPLGDEADLVAAVALAKITYGRPDDDAPMRTVITRRAKLLGLESLIPRAWAAGIQGRGGKVGQGGKALVKAAKARWRDEVRARLIKYETMALRVADPATAAEYGELAKAERARLAELSP